MNEKARGPRGAEIMFSTEQLDEPLLVELHGYWARVRRERRCPVRSDIDPIEIPHLLPHLAITEIVEDRSTGRKFRIRYRLAGTQIEQHFGCSLTNRYLDDLIQGPFIDFIDSLYSELIRSRLPHYSESTFGISSEADSLRAKRLLLPLSDDQQRVNMVLGGVIFSNDKPHRQRTVLHSHKHFVPSSDGKHGTLSHPAALDT